MITANVVARVCACEQLYLFQLVYSLSLSRSSAQVELPLLVAAATPSKCGAGLIRAAIVDYKFLPHKHYLMLHESVVQARDTFQLLPNSNRKFPLIL